MSCLQDSKAPYQPDPLQLKLSGKAGVASSSSLGLNIPLLSALISSLTPDRISSLMGHSGGDPVQPQDSSLPPLPPLPPLSHDLALGHSDRHYLEGAGGYSRSHEYREGPLYESSREMERLV